MESNTHGMEEQWKGVKGDVEDIAALILRKNKRQETWFDEESKKGIDERNDSYIKFIAQRTRESRIEFESARQTTDKLSRSKKRKYEYSVIEKMEE